MADEAAQFSDYYYTEGYLADWAAEFADLPPYGVRDAPATHERIQRRLDSRYDEWVRMGRPSQWREPRRDQVPSALHQVRTYVTLFGAIVLVALVGAVLDLQGFPWRLVQLAVVGTVLFMLVRSEIGSGR